jgi:hypothetical protein
VQVGKVQIDGRDAGIELDRPPISAPRLFQKAEVLQGAAEIVMGGGEVGPECDRATAIVERLL